jgi:hypothetical protein
MLQTLKACGFAGDANRFEGPANSRDASASL